MVFQVCRIHATHAFVNWLVQNLCVITPVVAHAVEFAGSSPPVSKKQRGPRRERFDVDRAAAIQTLAEQQLFWVLRDKHNTASGPPNYRQSSM